MNSTMPWVLNTSKIVCLEVRVAEIAPLWHPVLPWFLFTPDWQNLSNSQRFGKILKKSRWNSYLKPRPRRYPVEFPINLYFAVFKDSSTKDLFGDALWDWKTKGRGDTETRRHGDTKTRGQNFSVPCVSQFQSLYVLKSRRLKCLGFMIGYSRNCTLHLG
jgi:hypothetical protein